ncbi:hypothetical protein DUNSADRAFT_11359 [Dunaliella salina]|uniref:Encoded protein n=1 Tax=Dunaliella salina TaxID=3046 RepID=A0ABQ7FRT8_DUNSA|nr:hypothetical protein DUNSADRAFT_11359 [Dunaliella salina]|eukprot:KAF5825345.1 hypothetical protein DUNSADRAFT_11359 [Dunaliella salina]
MAMICVLLMYDRQINVYDCLVHNQMIHDLHFVCSFSDVVLTDGCIGQGISKARAACASAPRPGWKLLEKWYTLHKVRSSGCLSLAHSFIKRLSFASLP